MDMGPIWFLRETPDPAFDEFTQTRLMSASPQPSAEAPSQIQPVKSMPANGLATRQTVPPQASQVPGVSGLSRAAPMQANPQAALRPGNTSGAAFPGAGPQLSPMPQSGTSMPPDLAARIRTLDWAALKETALQCECCPMKSSRHHVVFAEGEPGPKLVIVGEAPGSEEDLQGIPFVGKSGQLLTSMLEALSIVRREDCVILNVLKCRPPGNRNPEPAEIACCTHYLMRQLELLEPKVLFLMGRFASQALIGLEPGAALGRMRGRVHQAQVAGRSIPAVATYHPSYLLRSPDQKAKAWEDLCLLRRTMREAGIEMRTKEKRWD